MVSADGFIIHVTIFIEHLLTAASTGDTSDEQERHGHYLHNSQSLGSRSSDNIYKKYIGLYTVATGMKKSDCFEEKSK